MVNYLNSENEDLIEIANQNAKRYKNSVPFPNIYFEDFFNPIFLESVLNEFPDLSKRNDVQMFENEKEKKLAGKGERHFGGATKSFMHYLNSEPFLNFLQILTGIKEPLIGDPYFYGGGQHEIKRGGLLKVHADFNKHQKLGLDRRINVLVYLNQNWKEEYGGHFELWDSKMEKCEKKILPKFNTMAIFSTTDFSYHGHPDPLNCPEGMSRKSLALYYYSNGRPAHEINDDLGEHGTLFQKRKNNIEDDIAFKKSRNIKTLIREITPPFILKGVSRFFND